MNKETVHYYLLAILSAIFITGNMGARVLVPLLSNKLQVSPTEIGIIVALYSFFPLILVISMGKWVDRIGAKIPILLSSFVGSIVLFVPFYMEDIVGIYILQIVSGLSQTLFAVAAQNYMGNHEYEKQRERNITMFSIGVATGSFIGPLIGGILSERDGYGYSFVFLGIFSLISVVMALFLINIKTKTVNVNTQKEKKHSIDLLKIRNIRKAFLISALILLGKDLYITYFPLLALEFGFTNKTIGLIVSIHSIAGILIRWMMPLLLNKYGRNTVIFSSIMISGIIFFSLPFFHIFIFALLSSFLLGMGLGMGQPLSITTTILSLPKDRVGEGLGLRLSFNRLTQVITPAIFGKVADLTSFSVVFWIVGFLIFIGSMGTKMDIQKDYKKTQTPIS